MRTRKPGTFAFFIGIGTLTSKCDIEGPGGSVTMQLEWHFDRAGFTGSEDAMRVLRQGGGQCRLMQHVKGTPRT
jgi:hypothetical protein